MILGTYDRRRVMSERPAHDDARIDGSAVQGASERFLEGNDAVPVVQEQACEDFVAIAPEAGLDVAPGVGRRGERATVPAKAGFHPAGVDFVHRMNPCPVLRREQDHAHRIVEQLAQAARGGEGRGVDVDADEPEEFVVVERGGSRALHAREQRFGGRRRRSGAGRIGRGGLGADGGASGVSVGMTGPSSAAWGSGPGTLAPRRRTTPRGRSTRPPERESSCGGVPR